MNKFQFVIVTLIFIIYIVIDFFSHESMFDANYQLAKEMQSNEHNFFTYFFQLCSFFAYPFAIGCVLLYYYITSPNKIQVLSIIIYCILAVYLNSLLKLFYNDPRPYFIYTDLKGYGCDAEYGNPSGHAMVGLILYYLIIDAIYSSKFTKFKSSQAIYQDDQDNLIQNQNQHERLYGFTLEFAVFFVFVFLIGFSRVYLGVHSFNQVLLGWVYGAYLLYLYDIYLEKLFERLLTKLVYKKFSDNSEVMEYILIIFVSFGIFTVALLLTYYEVNSSQEAADEEIEWRANLEKQNCTKFSFYSFAQNKCFLDCGVISAVFALFFSLLITNGSYTPEKFNEEWQKLRISIKILRFFILIILCGAIGFVLNLHQFESMYLRFFLNKYLSMICTILVWIKIIPFVYYKLNIDINGDLLKFNDNDSLFSFKFNQQDFLKNEYIQENKND